MQSAVVHRKSRLSPVTFLSALVVVSVVCVGLIASATPPAIQTTHGQRTGSLPKGVSIHPDGRQVVRTNFGNLNANNVGVYDANDLHLINSIHVPGIAVESVVSPDGRMLYVANFRRHSVQFVNLANRRVVHEVRVGSHPKIVILSRDGTRLFAANWSGNSVTELNPSNATIVRGVRAGRNPRGMAITRSGKLFVANFNGHSIDVYEGPTLAQHHRIENVCRIPRHLALSPDDATLYISCFSNSELAAMNTQTEQIDHRVSVGTWPKAIDVSPDGRYVYTANYGGSSVSIVDTTDWTVSTLDVPAMDHASGIVAAPSGVRFFVTGWYDAHLFAIGLAGSGPSFTVSPAVQALTLQRREFHRTHPVE